MPVNFAEKKPVIKIKPKNLNREPIIVDGMVVGYHDEHQEKTYDATTITEVKEPAIAPMVPAMRDPWPGLRKIPRDDILWLIHNAESNYKRNAGKLTAVTTIIKHVKEWLESV